MVAYLNLNRNSGVVAYSKGPDYIVIRFKPAQNTITATAPAGMPYVEQMKTSAHGEHSIPLIKTMH